MITKHLVYFAFTSALALGCDVKQDLGETAGDTGGGSSSGGIGESSTGFGSEDTGVLDTGPWSGTSEGTTGGAEDTGVLDTGPWWETSSTGDNVYWLAVWSRSANDNGW